MLAYAISVINNGLGEFGEYHRIQRIRGVFSHNAPYKSTIYITLQSKHGYGSSRERIFLRMKVPGNKSSRVNSLQAANVPGSKSSREQIGQGPIGTFAPGSELARERKGSVPHLTHAQQQQQCEHTQHRTVTKLQ